VQTDSFPMLTVVAASCAVHRANNGFHKKSDWSVLQKQQRSNSEILYAHFYDNEPLDVNDADHEIAVEIVDYLKGLGFKSFERDLTDFERQVLRFVTADQIQKDRLGIAASLPNVYYTKAASDAWADRERELGGTSEFQGIEGQRHTFDLKVEYQRFIPACNSTLVTCSMDNKHTVKFFSNNIKLEVGKIYSVTGYVKLHQLNKFNNAQETTLNRVRVSKS
jgi:hypothetical protein